MSMPPHSSAAAPEITERVALPVEGMECAACAVRIERQLGYKQPKYVHTIEAVSSFAGIARGKGGYWEDRGYDWYAGI